MKVYVASSWRNPKQAAVVSCLRREGFEVYDFRHPEPGDNGFHWSAIDPNWENWTARQFRDALDHPAAESGFAKDSGAMEWADACVYVLPCGRSASWEAGFIAGSGRPTCILLAAGEPELMFKLADHIAITIEEVIVWLKRGCKEGRRMKNVKTIADLDCCLCDGKIGDELLSIHPTDGDYAHVQCAMSFIRSDLPDHWENITRGAQALWAVSRMQADEGDKRRRVCAQRTSEGDSRP